MSPKRAKRAKGDRQVVDELAREAREHWVPGARADKLGDDAAEAERRLFDQIDAHERLPSIVGIGGGRRGDAGSRGDGRFWGSVAAIAAVAAAALVFAHSRGGDGLMSRGGDEESASAENGPALQASSASELVPSPSPSPTPASSATAPIELSAITRGGEVRVDGAGAVAREGTLHDGQTVESRGGEAFFTAPSRVEWLLENGTEVGVVRSGTRGGAIVLALRVGAVEAQVVPVPEGEAFAVDVDGVRVAVHGTHLRVAREERGGTRVVVDLSEGVISVGTPPKAGSTVGLLVTAPAHVEFSIVDLEGSLRVEKDPARVRAPVDIGATARSRAGAAEPSNAAARAPQLAPVAIAAVGPRTPSAPSPKPLTPTEVVLAAAHRCAEETVPAGVAGALTITSTLTVDVNSDGAATLATFAPPLQPSLQECVTRVVYATRWTEAGPHQIPIELHR